MRERIARKFDNNAWSLDGALSHCALTRSRPPLQATPANSNPLSVTIGHFNPLQPTTGYSNSLQPTTGHSNPLS